MDNIALFAFAAALAREAAAHALVNPSEPATIEAALAATNDRVRLAPDWEGDHRRDWSEEEEGGHYDETRW